MSRLLVVSDVGLIECEIIYVCPSCYSIGSYNRVLVTAPLSGVIFISKFRTYMLIANIQLVSEL
jgi:hypothetical protein